MGADLAATLIFAVEGASAAAVAGLAVFGLVVVAFVTALMCVVMAWAAGTPALSRAAGVTSFVFTSFGCALVLGGMLRTLRERQGDTAAAALDQHAS